MRLYLAGPMTGIPRFNFPAFDEAAETLRTIGYDVVSPAELDSPEHREAALASPDGDPEAYEGTTGETWGDLLARDVKIIADEVDAIVTLPGWSGSRGARLEVFVGRLCGRPVYGFHDGDVTGLAPMPDGMVDSLLGVGHGTPAPDAEVTQAGPDPMLLAGSHARRVGDHEYDGLVHPEDTGEVRVTAATGGQKGTKPQRFDLLPYDALARIAEVYAFGASKYDDHNWRKGYAWSLSYAALQRHLTAWWEGQGIDDESGLSHLAHAGFHVLALLTFAGACDPSLLSVYTALDDRFATVLAHARAEQTTTDRYMPKVSA